MWPFKKTPKLSLEEWAATKPPAPCGNQKEHYFWTEIECALQRWSDRRKGITPERRAWLDWSERNINPRADTAQSVFFSFKYVIEVTPGKFFSHEELGSWIPVPEFREMSYPNRELGNHCIWSWFRGNWANQWWQSGFLIDEFGGGDHVFAATNNEQDALWIAMKWGK